VREYLNMLRKQKRVYISRWVLPNERGGTAPVFAAGKRKDAERPKFDRAEYERRVKADPVKLEARRASRRKQEMLRQARAKPQNPFSALGL
jgi:hypothetical protein